MSSVHRYLTFSSAALSYDADHLVRLNVNDVVITAAGSNVCKMFVLSLNQEVLQL